MSLENRPCTWGRFLVRFLFGALFGSLFGLYLAAGASNRYEAALVIVAPALLIGLIAGYLGDRFWESFRDAPFWNPFRWFF